MAEVATEESLGRAERGPRWRNFDLLRLVAAASVVFSHSFDIVNGDDHAEPLVRLIGPGNILGLYGVFTFFIISGFLITASFEKSSLSGYALKRSLRIFPGLIACAVITSLVATLSAVEHAPLRAGLRASAHYVAKTVLLFDTSSASLPGVVFSENDFGRILNGSLWSLGPEFLCYIGVALLGVLGILGLRSALAILIVGLCTSRLGLLGNIGLVLPFFAAGAVLHFWRSRPALKAPGVCIALAGLVLGACLGAPATAFALFGAWLIVAFSTGKRQIAGATRFGDLSYGLYLYGWPIEQTVRHALGGAATWWLVFLIALPLDVLAAMISWRLVESPGLAWARSAAGRSIQGWTTRRRAAGVSGG